MPRTVQSENGLEFGSAAVPSWLVETEIGIGHIDPGKPWQHGNHECVNGDLRDACMSVEWLRNRAEAEIAIEVWRVRHNAVRPHSRLDHLTPEHFKPQHPISSIHSAVLG